MWDYSKPRKMWIDGSCFTLTSTKAKNTAGFNLKILESETNTEVTIHENVITIIGKNKSDIVRARHAIQSVIAEIREKQRPTHFFSIPIHSQEVQRIFELFKQEILNGYPIQGMHKSIFQSSVKLHLTIVVSVLLDKTEEDEAVSALNDCKTQVIEPLLSETGPLKIAVADIDCMNDNLERVNILYANAKVENKEDILQKIGNAISDYFYERGLVVQYKDNIKLHVTLINTKYRLSNQSTRGKNWSSKFPGSSNQRYKRQPFDARSIMRKYKNYYFGESVFDSVHLSYMHTGDDGCYIPLSIVKF